MTLLHQLDLLARAIDRFIPGNALEGGEIASFARLEKRVLEAIGGIKTLAFCVALHAGATLHATDRLVAGAFFARYVTGRSKCDQTTVAHVSLEHALPVAVNFVIGVDHPDVVLKHRLGRGDELRRNGGNSTFELAENGTHRGAGRRGFEKIAAREPARTRIFGRTMGHPVLLDGSGNVRIIRGLLQTD